MTYVKVDVAKPGQNLGIGGNKKAEIVIFDMDDVLAFPARDDNGHVAPGDITFKPGAYMIKLYATQHTIEAGHKGEGDPDKKGYIQNVKFEHPGSKPEIFEFDANWLNRNCGIIIQRCSDTQKMLYGTPCAPMQMVSEKVDTKDTDHTMFTFSSTQKGPIECNYQGTLTFDTGMGVAPADSTTVDVGNGEGIYELLDGTSEAAALTGLTNAVNGGSYTLLGSGGSYPSTIAASGNWLLKNGVAWTALAGSSITFKAFKDGVSSWKFLETSRI
jgi:hypothetical protein